MHILIAVHGFPPVQNAGAEKAAERIAHWLVANGHPVDVFTLGRLDAAETRLETSTQDGMTVHRLSTNLQAGDAFRNLYDNPIVGQAFEQVLARGPFDLLHVMSGYLLAGQVIHRAKQANIPVALTLTEYYHLCARLNLMHADSSLCSGPDSDAKCARCLLEEKRRYRYATRIAPNLLEKYWAAAGQTGEMRRMSAAVHERQQALKDALEAVDVVICPSRFIIEKHREFGFRTDEYVWIQHGLNRPVTAAAPAPRPDGCLRIGYMGQIKVHKGVDLLVDAARGLLDARCNVELQIWGRTGDQPGYANPLIEHTRAYPQIQWRGGFQGEQVWDVLAGMDVLVVPSRWYENCPTVILEAYKAGVPVVATNLGGMAELVQPERSGLLFELNQAADLSAQLERLAREPGLLERLRTGIPYVKSGDEEVSEIFAQYRRLAPDRAA